MIGNNSNIYIYRGVIRAVSQGIFVLFESFEPRLSPLPPRVKVNSFCVTNSLPSWTTKPRILLVVVSWLKKKKKGKGRKIELGGIFQW